MNPTKIVFFNVFAATVCTVAAYLNFAAGNVVVGSIMVGLATMNAGLAVANLNR
jgi:hypothetical protein